LSVQWSLAAAALLLVLHAPAGLACGYCVEDKIASTYDHAVVTRALGQGHHVAFFHIDGPAVPDEAIRRFIEASAESTPGVDKGSVRASVETVTLALAFDPGRASVASVIRVLDKKLAARRLSLMPLRVMDRIAELKEVKKSESRPGQRP